MYTNRKKYKMQGKTPAHRDAIMRTLIVELIKSRRVKTTPAKAKVIKSKFDRLVTYAKKDTNATKVKLQSFFNSNERAIEKLYKLIQEDGLKERNSGFTRVYKTLPRRGDSASQAYIMLVNYEAPEKKSKIAKVLEKQETEKAKKDSKKVTSKIKSAVGMKSEKKKATNSKNVESDVKTRRISM